LNFSRVPIAVVYETPVAALVDGGNNVGYVAVYRGAEIAIAKAKQTGIATVGVYNSYFSGRNAYYLERISVIKLWRWPPVTRCLRSNRSRRRRTRPRLDTGGGDLDRIPGATPPGRGLRFRRDAPNPLIGLARGNIPKMLRRTMPRNSVHYDFTADSSHSADGNRTTSGFMVTRRHAIRFVAVRAAMRSGAAFSTRSAQQSCVRRHARHGAYCKRPCGDATIQNESWVTSRLLRVYPTHILGVSFSRMSVFDRSGRRVTS
jgi:hypothetical protein